ncbi:hypothetical protein V495_07771 [Pseudogymnoascus sp. VKM F-4514 (FW-929)]|nr:hypothetical protein V495_07771 [Pseudogymnoascus sp. VKM F-4514 (FW-929)]
MYPHPPNPRSLVARIPALRPHCGEHKGGVYVQSVQHPANRLLVNPRWSTYSGCATQAIDAPRHASVCFWSIIAWLSRGFALEGLRPAPWRWLLLLRRSFSAGTVMHGVRTLDHVSQHPRLRRSFESEAARFCIMSRFASYFA